MIKLSIPASIINGLILLLVSIFMVLQPPTGTVLVMRNYGFPVIEYALLVAAGSMLSVIGRRSAWSVFAPLALLPYIGWVYYNSKLQVGYLNGAHLSVVVYLALLTYMMRAAGRFYIQNGDKEERVPPRVAKFALDVGMIPSRTVAGGWMIFTGILLVGHPDSNVVRFIEAHGFSVGAYGFILMAFGFLRLVFIKFAWDVFLVIPFAIYCIFVFWYITEMPNAAVPLILYAGLYVYIMRANTDAR